MVNEQEILTRIEALVSEEHQLENQSVEESTDAHKARINEIEVALDQCWDLLRQRRARKAAGLDPDGAVARPASMVENYQQ